MSKNATFMKFDNFFSCSIEDVWLNDFGRRKSFTMCSASSITLVYLRLFIKLTHTLEFILDTLLFSLND